MYIFNIVLCNPPLTHRPIQQPISSARGLRAFASHADEDFLIGETLRLAGWRVVLSRRPVHQPVGAMPVRSFLARHGRWGRIRKGVCLGRYEGWNATSISAATFVQEVLCGAVGAGAVGV
jgi:hypothetical protein